MDGEQEERARPDSHGRPADSKIQVPSGERVLLRPFIWDKSRHDATRRDHAIGAKMDTVSMRETIARQKIRFRLWACFWTHSLPQDLIRIQLIRIGYFFRDLQPNPDAELQTDAAEINDRLAGFTPGSVWRIALDHDQSRRAEQHRH